MQTYHIIIDKNKKETTQHGTYEFPLAVYTTIIRKNILGFVDWHWHDELQLCLVTQGTVDFTINEISVTRTKGDGIFINKGQMHRASNHEGIDSTYICLDFHSHLLSGFEGSLMDSRYVAPYIQPDSVPYICLDRQIDWQKKVLELVRKIAAWYDDKPSYYEMDVSIALQRIWQAFVQHYFSSGHAYEATHHNDRCKAIIAYIEQHYAEKIKLATIAAQINLAPGTCCREFKKHMDCSIFDYIMNYRIIRSAHLLSSTDKSINEIAYQCGFSNASYYIGQFKKKTNRTPYAYRRDNQ